MSINYKVHKKKPSALNEEIGQLLGKLKEIKKDKYSFWHNAVGETISKIAVPTYKKKDILFVKVHDSVWRFELTRRKCELLENINNNLNTENKLKDIIFK
ncbi:MAG: DUF721 domain-containing protein [Ignavibacteria bacterium]|nr:DciA family protein [Ignavibacteria bacterium]MCC7158686.1 DUF721 domain-containing protein [Ignavibacteria bacterium]